MNVGSLFTGIGGFDLGLERAGMRVVWQCESDDYCRRVLANHWPHVPRFEDVRDLSGAAGTPRVDVLCGGFPCQDISLAGKGAGIEGSRSGLWAEYARLIGELRPRYVIVENVSALLGRGLDRVLGDLSALGYDAEWDCIPASAVGAPHRRDRVWLVAYSQRDDGGSWGARRFDSSSSWESEPERPLSHMADSIGVGRESGARRIRATRGQAAIGTEGHRELAGGGWWAVEPDVGRVATRVPRRVDRLRSLGNALVPQIAEWIGRRIMSYEAA